MTLSSQGVQIAYDGDGATLAFTFEDQFLDTDELAVFLRNKTTGVEVLQFETTDYAVTGGAGASGTVTFVVAPPATEEVHLRRVTDDGQIIAIAARRKIPSAAIEEALDRLSMIVQELREDFDRRTVKIPVTDLPVSGADPITELGSSIDRALNLFSFDAIGGVTLTDPATLDPATVLLSALAQTVLPDNTTAGWKAALGWVENTGDLENMKVGLRSARPSTAALGKGIYVSRDTGELSYSNGSGNYFELGLEQVTPLPTAAVDGKLFLETERKAIFLDKGVGQNYHRVGAMPPGFIFGLEMTWKNAAELTVGRGACTSRYDQFGDRFTNIHVLIDMNSIYGFGGETFDLDKALNTSGDWTEGADGNLFTDDAPLANNTAFRIFALSKLDGSVDFGADTAVNANNLVAAGKAPNAAGYKFARRIGWIYIDGSGNMVEFVQRGDAFAWDVPFLDFSDSGQDHSTALIITLTRGFPDTVVSLSMAASQSGNAQDWWVGGAQATPGVPDSEASPGVTFKAQNASPSGDYGWVESVLLNSSSQFQVKSDATDTSNGVFAIIRGWVDDREKLF